MNVKKVYADLVSNYLNDSDHMGCLYGEYDGVKMLSPDRINVYFLQEETPFPFDVEKLHKLPEGFVKNFIQSAEAAEPVEEKVLQDVEIGGRVIETVCLRSANNQVVINKKFITPFSKNATYHITGLGKRRANYAFVYENDQLVGSIAEIRLAK